MKHLEGVITSDWHLRKDVPVSRPETEEEWHDFQFDKVNVMMAFAIRKLCKIYQVGDVFERSQPYYGIVGRLKKMFLKHWDLLVKLAGNHDLPYHSFENVLNSGWYLAPGTEIESVYKGAMHFGEEQKFLRANIVFTHQLTFPDEKSRPFEHLGKTAQELLDEFPNAKWIFTGDYHKNFHYENNGRHVINPGCMTRQSAGEESYTCGFYYVDTRNEVVEFHELFDNVVMDTEHIKTAKERDTRLDAFMEKVESTDKITFSFKDNLNNRLGSKKVPKSVRSIITEIETEVNIGVSK